jgi:hypothetical protein
MCNHLNSVQYPLHIVKAVPTYYTDKACIWACLKLVNGALLFHSVKVCKDNKLKISFIFNSGDTPITIDDKLLSDIEADNKAFECSFLEQSAP